MSRIWTEYEDGVSPQELAPYAKGCYQTGILHGSENISGSSLRGKAKHWGIGYRNSYCNLLDRIHAAGYRTSIRTADHGARILVIGRKS